MTGVLTRRNSPQRHTQRKNVNMKCFAATEQGTTRSQESPGTSVHQSPQSSQNNTRVLFPVLRLEPNIKVTQDSSNILFLLSPPLFFPVEETKAPEDDEMEKLYKSLEQASLSPLGDRRPSTKKELRKSFVKRCKNPSINEKLHKIRTLNSTLKVKPFQIVMTSAGGAKRGWFCSESHGNCSVLWRWIEG